MAWSDMKLGEWGATLLTGVGVAVAAPVLLPVIGAVLRPMFKEVIKAGLLVTDTLHETVAEGEEQLSDLMAEARAEYAASKNN